MKKYLVPGDKFSADSVILVWLENNEVSLDPDFGLVYATDPAVLVYDQEGRLIETPLLEDENGPYYNDNYNLNAEDMDIIIEQEEEKPKDKFSTFV